MVVNDGDGDLEERLDTGASAVRGSVQGARESGFDVAMIGFIACLTVAMSLDNALG